LSRHKMKLAIVTRSFPPDVTSGRETVIYNLWRQAGQQDDVALISGWRYSPRHLPPGAMLVDQSSASRVVNYARFFFSSAMLVRHLRPDVVLSNAIELGPVASPSAVIAYDLNFGQADSRRGSQSLRRAIVRWRLRGFTHVVAISQTTANQLVALGMRHGQVSVILNGVDLDRFRPLPAAGGDRLTVVYPSRIVHGKGQHVAIEALRRLDETLLARTKLVIVGYVDDSRYLEQIKAAIVGLPVEIHTNVGDIAPYYQSADVVVFPTIMEEGFGYTAAEALACGKPVIHSDYPAIREATGGVGVPVPVGDAAALAQAMASLLRDPERRDALGRAGRIHAEAHYDWAGVYRQYRQVLGELIPGRQGR
jgi:glycosyltransferase involved in cell wall biosynthesis